MWKYSWISFTRIPCQFVQPFLKVMTNWWRLCISRNPNPRNMAKIKSTGTEKTAREKRWARFSLLITVDPKWQTCLVPRLLYAKGNMGRLQINAKDYGKGQVAKIRWWVHFPLLPRCFLRLEDLISKLVVDSLKSSTMCLGMEVLIT